MRSEALIFALAEDPINRIEALLPWRLALRIHAICGKPRSGGTCRYSIGSY